MMTMTPQTIAICVDCVNLLANGEVTDGNGEDITLDHGQNVDVQWGNTEITLGHAHNGEDCPDCTCGDVDCWENMDGCPSDGWFSWSMCEGCGSRLGGDRFYATVWLD